MNRKKRCRGRASIAPIVAAVLLAAGAAAQNAPSEALKPDTRSQGAGLWKGPDEVYAKICAKCHDTGVGPALNGRGLAPELTIMSVRTGPGAMPAFRQTDVDDAMLKRVAEMIESSKAAEAKK